MKTTHSTIHRVEIVVPNEVWERFGHLPEYDKFAASLSHCVETSGSLRYADAIEWAEAPTRQQCETWAAAWHAQLSNWLVADAEAYLKGD